MTVLVTGAAGFIGSHLCEKLIYDGWNVHGLDDLSNGNINNLEVLNGVPEFTFVRDNVQNIDKIPFDFEAIVHLAAMGSVPRSIKEPSAFMQNNVMGFQSVLEFARSRGIRKVFYASSSSVYGNSSKLYRIEDDRTAPASPYAATKLINEIMAEGYARSFWLKPVGLRFFNVFGTKQRFDSPYSAVIPKFCQSLLNTGRIQIFGDGQQTRTFTPVSFVVDAISQLVAPGGDISQSIFNVTDETYAMSVYDLAKVIGRILNIDPVIEHLPEREGDVKSSVGIGERMREEIVTRSVDFPMIQELQKTCFFYRDIILRQ